MLKKITNCTQCLFVRSMRCKHEKSKDMDIGEHLTDHSLPDNCPLLKNTFSIKAIKDI